MTMFPTSRELSSGLSICARCLELTSHGDLQRCACEPKRAHRETKWDCPSGYHLCWICARGVAGGLSKYSWEVCQNCHNLMKGFLPYGRHSFMNLIFLPFGSTDQKIIEEGIQELLNFNSFWESLYNWGHLQAHLLLSGIKRWEHVSHISLRDWEKQFPPDMTKSITTTEGFLGVKSLAKWKEERQS